jgi:hypothetical protein
MKEGKNHLRLAAGLHCPEVFFFGAFCFGKEA